MIIDVIFDLENSIHFYKVGQVFFYMTRDTAVFQKISGEIFDSKNQLLLKVKTSPFSRTDVTYQNLKLKFTKKSLFINDVFELNKNELIKISNFILFFGNIYWNEKKICKIKYFFSLKYSIKLKLEFCTKDEEQIYYACIFYCVTLLNAGLY